MRKIIFAAIGLFPLFSNAQAPMEGFENAWTGLPAAPQGWTVVNESGTYAKWQQSAEGSTIAPPFMGLHSAYLDKENVVSGTAKDWLISPLFTVPINAEIQFYSKLTIVGDQGNIYKVLGGTNTSDLASFTEIYSATELEINPVQTDYILKEIAIPANYAGQQLRIAFVMTGDDGDRWLIDNVKVASNCPEPTNLNATNINQTGADLSWTSDAASWEVEVVSETNIPMGSGVIVNGPLPYHVVGLIPGQTYKFYVRAVCGDGGLSNWVGPYYFDNTTCPTPTNVVITTLDPMSVTYAWTPTNASNYDYWFTTTNALPNVSTIPQGNVASPTVTLSGLDLTQDYKFYVRSHCGPNEVSPWAGLPGSPPVINNVIHGIVKYDSNTDGICNADDSSIPYTQVEVQVNDVSYSTYTDQNGQYTLYGLEDGTYNLSLQVVSPAFTGVAPVVQQVVLNDETNEVSINHCLGQPLELSDIKVAFVSIIAARPGFDAYYNVVVQNSGSVPQENVVITLSFDDNRIDYVSSDFAGTAASAGTLSIPLGTLQPFSVANGFVTFHVMAPPVNVGGGGEFLHFEAVLSAVANDATPDNNQAVLEQVIVNSYDPNDITVHEGAKIFEEQADDYLTYTIRFQNTGNGNAINVKLENTLDALLDWATFEPVASSHANTIKRTDDQLEFYFENIQLPYESADEPASHGYVTYRIKPKAEYGLTDIISNTVDIYFDFNEAIVTNTATTEVIALAGLNDNALMVAKLYPNPVKDQLHIEVKEGELQLVTIHDVNGRLCLSANAGVIDTNMLNSGIYFVKVTTDAGTANYKIIKH